MARRRRHRRATADAGFTILELLLVMAVVAALAIALSMGVKRVRASDLRADTTRVAQALRTAYAMATQTGKHHRVVFDIEKRTYQIEVCEGKIKLHKERREEREQEIDETQLEKAKRFLEGDPNALGAGMGFGSEFTPEVQAAESPEAAAEKAKALAGIRLGTGRCEPPKKMRGGKEVPDPRGKVRKLIKENQFEAIWVQHLEDPVEKEGFVSINFFPLGYAEKAVVQIVNDDDDRFTLLVHGVTGRVEFKDGDWRKPEEHMMRDGRGRRAEER